VEIEIDTEIVSAKPLTKDEEAMVRLAMLIQALVQTFKELGFDVDKAVEKLAGAIRRAWEQCE